MTTGNTITTPAALVPHAGAMCLLDEVASWDDGGIRCRSASHRLAAHPLRRDGSLSSIHLLEYAAQAVAVHGALVSGTSAARGPAKLLAAARDFELHVTNLDGLSADLLVDAERMITLGEAVLYSFQVSTAGDVLAAGRLSVMPAAGEPS